MIMIILAWFVGFLPCLVTVNTDPYNLHPPAIEHYDNDTHLRWVVVTRTRCENYEEILRDVP